MSVAILLLGTNLGDKQENMIKARELIEQNIGRITKASSIYASEAWGFDSQNTFLNQTIEVKFNSTPHELLLKTQEVEKQLGRKKVENGSAYNDRVMDVDILFFDDLELSEKELKLPHPEIPNRKFTLLPLVEMDKRLKFTEDLTVGELLESCMDKTKVWKIEV